MKPMTGGIAIRVLGRALVFFVILNLAFAVLQPLPWLGSLSLYGRVFPARERFPFGDDPARDYNLVVGNLDALFASHALAAPKAADEYRVVVLGDSSVWGVLLAPADTLTGKLNAMALRAPDGRHVRFYNLGYPDFSVAKDLMLMRRALAYHPDLIVWAVTLHAFVAERQPEHVLLQDNPADARAVAGLGLPLALNDARLAGPDLWGRTLVGQRRPIADLMRLQVLGAMWAATGIDQDLSGPAERLTIDLEPNETLRGVTSADLEGGEVLWSALDVGVKIVREADVPLLIINEPTATTGGANSDLRYNAFYPRRAYDRYRAVLARRTGELGVPLLDVWDLSPLAEYTNSPVHLNPAGSARLAAATADALARVMAAGRR